MHDSVSIFIMALRQTSISKKAGQKSGGGGCLIVFGVLWLIFGCVFLYFGGRTAMNQYRLYEEAVQVPCEISKLEISDNKKNDKPFRPDVAFTYEWDGQRRKGDQLAITNVGSDQYEDLYATLRKIRESDQDWCYVDPQNGKATLLPVDKNSLLSLVGFVIPAIVGLAMVLFGIHLSRKSKASAISSKGRDEKSKSVGCFFFSIFALAGIAMAIFMWSKALRSLEVKDWVATDAEVIWSRVKTHQGDDSTTYSVDVFYQYQFGGESYRSNRYVLLSSSSSGRKKKQLVVDSLPKGTALTCYVNPKEPWRAIVNREYGLGGFMWLLFPIPFLAVGIGGSIYMLRSKPNDFYPDSEDAESRADQVSSMQKRLKRSSTNEVQGRWAKLIFMLIFAVIWNGFILFFLFGIGDDSLFLKLFMIPFVLVGILVIGGVFHSFIGLFSPHYEISLADNVENEGTYPGHEVPVSWVQKGGFGEVSRLRIWLVGEESATYSRGTNTITSKSVFYEQVVEDRSAPVGMQGEVKVRVPFDLPPSFYSDHNRIVWSLVFLAEVPKRPDFRFKKNIQVLPYTEQDFQ